VEEGKSPSGSIVFTQFPRSDKLDYLGPLSEAIPLSAHKRITKVLQSVAKDGALVSDYKKVVGISCGPSERKELITVGLDRGKAQIIQNDQTISHIINGEFRCAPSKTPAEILHDVVGSMALPECINSAADIITAATMDRHGCTIVLDLANPPKKMSGETFESGVDPKLRPSVAAGMSSVDGAIQLDKQGNLVAFGVLLDGDQCDGEDRSRGARFNSALRFTKRQSDVIVITASADGPVTIFKNGQVAYSDPFFIPDTYQVPEVGIQGVPVSNWLEKLVKRESK
jgi:hypothetical protein